MKIGIDIRKLSDYGIGTHIRHVVLAAAGKAKEHEFVLYHDPVDTFDASTPHRMIEEKSRKYSIQEHFQLARKARKAKIELFHSPHYTLPLFLRMQTIVTVHDLIHFKFREYFPYWKVQAAEFIIRKAVSRAGVVITVSETTKGDLLNWMPFLENKVRVIYNRLPEQWFSSPATIDIQSLGIEKEFILYAGNFKKHKGIDILLDAHKSTHGLPQLVIVGHSHDADHELTQRILTTPNVRMLGFASSSLLQALYSRALLFVFPSRYEGFGYPPLEAMACGCPVLSSDAPAMKEILGDAVEFFECNNPDSMRDKLIRLLTDSELRRKYSELGKSHAKKYTSDESINKMVTVWNSFKK